MNRDTLSLGRSPARRLNPVAAVLLGGMTVGVLDLLDAIVFFGARGVRPVRILQSIAAGLLGRSAFQGGAQTALLGACLHFFIACSIALTFYLGSLRLPVLVRRPVLCGMAYGLMVYVVMNYVVVPLSAAGRGSFSWPVFLNGVAIHLLGVGPAAALFAARAHRALHGRG